MTCCGQGWWHQWFAGVSAICQLAQGLRFCAQSSSLVSLAEVYGVPDVMIELIWSLYDRMSATVMVEGGECKPFLVQNGLR